MEARTARVKDELERDLAGIRQAARHERAAVAKELAEKRKAADAELTDIAAKVTAHREGCEVVRLRRENAGVSDPMEHGDPMQGKNFECGAKTPERRGVSMSPGLWDPALRTRAVPCSWRFGAAGHCRA